MRRENFGISFKEKWCSARIAVVSLAGLSFSTTTALLVLYREYGQTIEIDQEV